MSETYADIVRKSIQYSTDDDIKYKEAIFELNSIVEFEGKHMKFYNKFIIESIDNLLKLNECKITPDNSKVIARISHNIEYNGFLTLEIYSTDIDVDFIYEDSTQNYYGNKFGYVLPKFKGISLVFSKVKPRYENYFNLASNMYPLWDKVDTNIGYYDTDYFKTYNNDVDFGKYMLIIGFNYFKKVFIERFINKYLDNHKFNTEITDNTTIISIVL